MSSKFFLSAAAILLLVVPAAALDSYTLELVTVHAEPSPDSAEIASLLSGQKLDMRYCEDGWCFVVGEDLEGWVLEEQLDLRGVAP